jgi:hypothetical protein
LCGIQNISGAKKSKTGVGNLFDKLQTNYRYTRNTPSTDEGYVLFRNKHEILQRIWIAFSFENI